MNAIIFHATDSNPDQSWYKWLKAKLEARGYTVELPHYPNINKGPAEEFVPEVLKAHSFDDQTILVGHSAGSPLILSILERIDTPIKQAVLVAGYSEDLENHQPIIQAAYNWDKIKSNAQDFVFINSENDPWGCDDKQGHKMFEKLGGTLVIKNDGHFSTAANPAYKEFPLLEGLVGAMK